MSFSAPCFRYVRYQREQRVLGVGRRHPWSSQTPRKRRDQVNIDQCLDGLAGDRHYDGLLSFVSF